jgi:hypothetical protein
MHLAGDWLRRHRFAAAAVVATALGLAFGWNWLLAIGILPSLFAMLPCLLMLGMCMRGMNGEHNPETNDAIQPADDSEATHRVSPRQTTLQLEDHSNA